MHAILYFAFYPSCHPLPILSTPVSECRPFGRNTQPLCFSAWNPIPPNGRQLAHSSLWMPPHSTKATSSATTTPSGCHPSPSQPSQRPTPLTPASPCRLTCMSTATLSASITVSREQWWPEEGSTRQRGGKGALPPPLPDACDGESDVASAAKGRGWEWGGWIGREKERKRVREGERRKARMWGRQRQREMKRG